MNDQPMNSAERRRRRRGCRRGRTTSRSRAPRAADQRRPRSRRAAQRAPQAAHGHAAAPARARPRARPWGRSRARPTCDTSGPKSEPSRLEVMITVGRVRVGGDPRRDVEAVDVGELDVEQHDLGPQPAALASTRRGAVRRPRRRRRTPRTPAATARVARKDGWSSTMRTVCAMAVTIVVAGGAAHTAGHTQRRVAAARRRRPRRVVCAEHGRAGHEHASRPPRRTGRPSAASIPPSTSSAGAGRRRARAGARASPSERGRNAWPPQPGLTVMHSTRSRSPTHLATRPRPACPGRAPGRRGSRRRATAASA